MDSFDSIKKVKREREIEEMPPILAGGKVAKTEVVYRSGMGVIPLEEAIERGYVTKEEVEAAERKHATKRCGWERMAAMGVYPGLDLRHGR